LNGAYAGHPDPHACPTRRSSDRRYLSTAPLLGPDAAGRPVARPEALRHLQLLEAPVVDGGLRAGVVKDSEAGTYTCVLAVSGSQDRKSTRLNSSHVKISYAVFC